MFPMKSWATCRPAWPGLCSRAPPTPPPGRPGPIPPTCRELVGYWADGFDWRAAEKALNAFPQYTAEVAGRRVHFVHLRGSRPEGAPAPLPLVMTHGWPSSLVEMLRAAPLLADPARYGGDPADAFDVVIPSLPGFLYSDLPSGPFTRKGVAEIWHALMTESLGYQRFGAFGGDIGGGVTQWLGSLYPEEVAGVHLTSAPAGDDFTEKPPTAEEEAYLAALAAYDLTDQGYSEIMWTRPDTIAAALADSPAGLAAWIVDKYRDWSDLRRKPGITLEQGHPADGGHTVLGDGQYRLVVPAVLQLPAEPAGRASWCRRRSR